MPAPNLLTQLETFLSLNNRRQAVVAGNMANIDTPGYRTQDLNFEQEFSRAQNLSAADVHPAVHAVRGLGERPDGNNVDLDRESLLLSQTQLQYQLGTQLLKQRFHQLLTAINGDK